MRMRPRRLSLVSEAEVNTLRYLIFEHVNAKRLIHNGYWSTKQDESSQVDGCCTFASH